METTERIDIWQNESVVKIIRKASETNHRISSTDIEKSEPVRSWGMWAIDNYAGSNKYMLDIQLRIWNSLMVSSPQIAACLRILVDEYRIKLTLNPRPAIPNGTYTIVVELTRKFGTIRLQDCPKHFNKPAGTQIASFLGGNQNDDDSSYVGFAFVYPGRSPQVWRKFKDNSTLCYNLGLLLETDEHLRYGEQYALESKHCFRCNRPLTVAVSIYSGLGPTCAKILGVTRKEPPKKASELTHTGLNNIIIDNGEDIAQLQEELIEAQRKAQTEIDELFPE